jgi:GNAT superfamily N-acetyltransferase
MHAQHLGADMVWARRAEYLADAESARAAASFRRERALRRKEDVRLAERLCVRVLEPADAGHLRALFGRLSMRSRWMRYLAPLRSVSEPMLRRLAAIDHDRHEALGAFDGVELVAVAHYFRDPVQPARAEISVEVADSHQRRGVGQRLLNDLAKVARGRGISEFQATASLENTGVLAMVRNSQWPATVTRSGPEVDIALTLPDTVAVPTQGRADLLAPCP